MTMANKLGRVFLYSEGHPSIKSQNLLITWSRKITRKIKYAISLQSQYLCALNLARW